MKSLHEILDFLATHKKKLVLMQGRNYWRIEDLFAQAKRDLKSEVHRKAVLDEAFILEEHQGKTVIKKLGEVIFFEPGFM